MPWKTKSGTHYHMTEGCCNAFIQCDTKGLEPCSICCGAKANDGIGAGAGSPSGGSNGVIAVDSPIVSVDGYEMDGVAGTLYKLGDLLDMDTMRSISKMDGVSAIIAVTPYAPKTRQTGIFVEDGYDYAITKANDITEVGVQGMHKSMPAPVMDISPSEGQPQAKEEPAQATAEQSPLGDDWPERRQATLASVRQIRDICQRAGAGMRNDWDVSYATGYVTSGLSKLLSQCDIERLPEGKSDPYTTNLVDAYIGFGVCPKWDIGGSNADYCANHALRGISGYRIRLRETPEADLILQDIREGIRRYALYPRKMDSQIKSSGVPLGRSEFIDARLADMDATRQRFRQMTPAQRKEEWGAEARRWAYEWLDLTRMPDSDEDLDNFLRRANTEREIEEKFYAEARGRLNQGLYGLADTMGDAGYREFQDEYAKAFKAAADEVIKGHMTKRALAQGKKKRSQWRISRWA